MDNNYFLLTNNLINKEIINNSLYVIIFDNNKPELWNSYKNKNFIDIKRVFIGKKDTLWSDCIIMFVESNHKLYKIKNYFNNNTKINIKDSFPNIYKYKIIKNKSDQFECKAAPWKKSIRYPILNLYNLFIIN